MMSAGMIIMAKITGQTVMTMTNTEQELTGATQTVKPVPGELLFPVLSDALNQGTREKDAQDMYFLRDDVPMGSW